MATEFPPLRQSQEYRRIMFRAILATCAFVVYTTSARSRLPKPIQFAARIKDKVSDIYCAVQLISITMRRSKFFVTIYECLLWLASHKRLSVPRILFKTPWKEWINPPLINLIQIITQTNWINLRASSCWRIVYREWKILLKHFSFLNIYFIFNFFTSSLSARLARKDAVCHDSTQSTEGIRRFSSQFIRKIRAEHEKSRSEIGRKSRSRSFRSACVEGKWGKAFSNIP